jgi:hypothetical protein
MDWATFWAIFAGDAVHSACIDHVKLDWLVGWSHLVSNTQKMISGTCKSALVSAGLSWVMNGSRCWGSVIKYWPTWKFEIKAKILSDIFGSGLPRLTFCS